MALFVWLVTNASRTLVAPLFGYLGFEYRTPDPAHFAVVTALVCALAALMPIRLTRPSQTVLWVNFLLATAPSMIVPQFTPVVTSDSAFRFALEVAFAWAIVIALTSERISPRVTERLERVTSRKTRTRRRGFADGTVTIVLGGLSVLMSIYLVLVFGASLHFASLTDVRGVRLGYREALKGVSVLVGYALLWVANVVNPTLLMRGLLRRSIGAIVVGAAGQLLIYSYTGYKTVLLSVPALVGIFLWLRRRESANAQGFLFGVTGLIGILVVLAKALGSQSLILLFTRFIVSQGNLAAAYVAIFGNRQQLYWSQNILSPFVDYPYQVSPNFLVGGLYRNSSDISANVNLFGDGFISMKLWGIVIECLVLVLVVWFVDLAASGMHVAQASAVVLLPAFALANSNIFTAILTHGFLVAILVLLVMRSAAPPGTSESMVPSPRGADGSPRDGPASTLR